MNYANSLTPRSVEELSQWAKRLSDENELKDACICQLEGRIRSLEHPLILKDYGPKEIHANEPFNIQPNGESALWAITENATPDSIIVFNGTPLISAPHPDGKLVTAIFPKHLYYQPGEYPLYLQDTRTATDSNQITMEVLAEKN